MPTINMHDLTDETRHRIALIQAEAAFRDGENLRLKDVLLGLIELGSIRAVALLEEQNDQDHK